MIQINQYIRNVLLFTLCLTTVKCQAPAIGRCPNLQGTLQIDLPQLEGFYFELQKSSVIPSSLFPTCLTINVYPEVLDATFANVLIHYIDSIDGLRKAIRGTIELIKLINADGTPTATGSDFILRIRDSPLQLVPQLTYTTQFPIKLLNNVIAEDGSNLFIFYSCQDLPSLPFLPFKTESVWVFGFEATNRLTESGRAAVVAELARFSIDDSFLQDTSQVCT